MYYICLDIGGTSIKYGLLNIEGKILVKGTVPTRIIKNENYILVDVKKIIKNIQEEYGMVYDIKAVCVSTAGVVDPVEGKVVYAGPTIPLYTGTEIKKEIEKMFNLPCTVENDVNCAGLGEYWRGTGVNSKSMVCLTVGTGIGGSIILDGKLLNGFNFTAGEIGYMDVKGKYIQDIASTRYLVKMVKEEKTRLEGIECQLTGIEIFELAKNKDKICVDAIDILIENLSVGIRNIIYLLNPEVIVIGGGITAQKEYLEERIRNKVNSGLISDSFRKTRIELAKQQNQAGLLGALYNYLNTKK